MHMGERIYEWRTKRDMSQQALANAVGCSQSTIGGLEAGRNPGSSLTPQIAVALGVDALWLATGKGTPDGKITAKHRNGDDIVIPQYNTGGKMGHGLVLRDQPGVIKSWNVSPEWVRENVPRHTGIGNLCIVTGFGPSMKGMFDSGDPLLLDRGITGVEFDAVYFFRVGNDGYIKLLQRIPGPDGTRLKAKSKNPDYDDFWIDETMDFEVFGQIIKVWKGENL